MTVDAGAASQLERRLRRTAPAVWFQGDPRDYTVDGVTPSLVVAPDSPEAVAAVLAEASAAGAALVPWGGGSHMGLGMPPERYDAALDMRRLDALIAYEPADLTVTVQAGMPFSRLQGVLGERGQWLPLDPPAPSEATVGGVLAANASGPARVRYGTARDLVIGMTVATADGRLVKSGGRVVKNVAGYDMAKLHIGGLGTLGVITQVSFKVAPLPKEVRSLALEGNDDGLLKAAAEVGRRRLPVTGSALLAPAGAVPRLLLRFAGSLAAVDRACNEAMVIAEGLGLASEQVPPAAWHQLASQLGGPLTRVRLSHSPSRAAEAIDGLRKTRADVISLGSAGVTYGGLIAPDEEAIAALAARRRAFEATGGALVIESAPPEVKLAVGAWGTPPPGIALMRALKDQMDPRRVLSPGRFVAGI
jgi:glycolate oxidase FAD binding subunit